jgi:hypothetical protein
MSTRLAEIFRSLSKWESRFTDGELAAFEVGLRAIERELPDAAVVVVAGPDHDPVLNALDECASVIRRLRDDLTVVEDRLTALTRQHSHAAGVDR